jgi:thiol:disulfide interchange protein DsbC
MGNEVMYSDAEGNFLIQGSLIDVKQKRNLTEERIEKLSSIPFDQLPLKTAFTQVRGNGKRKLAVFADPNCGYCKRFEKDLQKLDNVTIYHFLYPILGEDSKTKSKHIWCAKDKAKVWNDWMIHGTTPATANCDASAVDTIVAFGQKMRITGTPMILFAAATPFARSTSDLRASDWILATSTGGVSMMAAVMPSSSQTTEQFCWKGVTGMVA